MGSTVTISLPTYSDALVGFVRALDSAEMAVRTCNWHFGDMEVYTPELLADPIDVPSWAKQSLERFADQLPVLRAIFKSMVAAESEGLFLEANGLGDVHPPTFVEEAFAPVLDGYIKHQPATLSTLATLPDSLKEQTKDCRVVYWDNEVYLIPESFPNSFVEVWFRRAIGYWEDGGAYPLRLETRAYGWQAFGIER